MTFNERYPHGVLSEQEGGIPNDVENYEAAHHYCRKHRHQEWVCKDRQLLRQEFKLRGELT